MPYQNKLVIEGRVGRDCELSYSQGGKAIAKWSVAVSQGKDRDTDWFNCVSFGNQAEQFASQIAKGDWIQCQGKMTSNKGNDGKTYWQMIVFDVSKPEFQQQPAQPQDDWSDVGKVVEDDLGLI